MQASVIRNFGGSSELTLDDFTEPQARSGYTIVDLRAAALNWHDLLVRQGRYNSPLPHVLGADGAGVIAGSNDEVIILPSLQWGETQSAPGPSWEILGDHRPGTYAHRVSVPTSCVFPKPTGLSWHEAAALPLVGVTTYRALFSRARLRASESLLVLGAGGGVATMAVSLGVAAGASVFVTSSTPGKIEQAKANGATDGVLYTDPDWAGAAKKQSPASAGFDVVLDTVGTWEHSIRALKPGGRLVVLGASRSGLAQLNVREFYFGQYDLQGTTMGSEHDFRGLLDFMSSEAVSPPLIDRVFDLSEAAAAHEYLESGDAFGKIVLDINPETEEGTL